MVKIVERVAPHDPHGVLASCALRLLHQFSNSKSIVKSIMAQCEIVKPMATLKATLMPLHKDAPFTFEIIRKMVEENSVQAAKRDSVSSAAGFAGGTDAAAAVVFDSAVLSSRDDGIIKESHFAR